MDRLVSYSPVTLQEVGSVDVTPPETLPDILEDVREAQRAWSAFSKRERTALLKKLRAAVTENAETIARTAYLETGKPKADAFNTEVMTSSMMIRECERWVKGFKSVRKVDQGSARLLMTLLGRKSYIEYRPLGVVAVISPYNFPFAIPFTETVTAVAAGNGVILKPSSYTPLCGELVQRMFDEAGFPKGLVRTVSGSGVGSALSKMKVDRIVFTGSTSTGGDIMRSASENLVPVTLELGGKDAMIVFEDADMDRTASGAVWGSFVNAGQVCVGIKRIFVQRSAYDGFIKEFVRRTEELKQGDGWSDNEISVGPMINEIELKKMETICDSALEQGGRIMTGGKRDETLEGYFFKPTVITDLAHSSDIVSEEIFGPIVTVFPFEDEDEAVGLANDSIFALGGSVWTKDLERGRRVASRIGSGTVDVNNVAYTFGLPATPWGGRGCSGFGTTHGMIGFMDMMFPHHIHVDKGRFRRDPWWMPYDREKTELQKEMIDSFFGSGKGKLRTAMRILPVLRNKR